jgi:hypothetical protein
MRSSIRLGVTAGLVLLTAGLSWVVAAVMRGTDKDVPVESAATMPNGPLTVTMTLSKSKVAVMEEIPATFRVTNVSETAQSYRGLASSWNENWRFDNPHIGRIGVDYAGNPIVTVTLSPHQPKDVFLTLVVTEGTPTGPLAFKAGFTPPGTAQIFWSGELTINVMRKKR